MSVHHSLGPWGISEPRRPAAAGETFRILRSGDRTRWNGYVADVMWDSPNAEANARLIAAAPDMLEALQWIADIADKQYEQDDGLRANGARQLARISDRARDAIAKATGEA